jgi:hypothetical protein
MLGPDQPLFPASPLGVRVSLAIGQDPTADPATWSWTDVSSRVRYVDRIVITRGRRNEQTQASAATCRLTFLNLDGMFSPRNVYGPYWGMLRRNTPLRVEVNPGTGWHTRFTGFVPEWSPTTDISGKFRVVPVAAQGVLRRLEQGDTPLKSALYRAVLTTAPEAYWPLEDGSGSTVAGSAVGGPAMTTAGTVTFAAYTDLAGAAQTPDIDSGSLFGTITGVSATSWHAEFAIKMPFINGAVARVYTSSTAAGAWRIFLPTDASGSVQVYVTDFDGGSVLFALLGTTAGAAFENAWHHVGVTAEQSGANIVGKLYVDGVLQATSSGAGTLGAPYQFWANHLVLAVTSMAHIAVGSSATISTAASALAGYDGELAAARFDRLGTEEDVPHDVALATTTEAMGPQGVDTFLNLERAAELADEGLIVERFDGRLGLDPRALRYNRDATLTLNYSAGHVGDVPDITDDDLLTRNDVTITRDGGSSGRAVETTGPMGTDGSVGVGRYDEAQTVNLNDDDQPLQHASWREHIGTVDEQRFPQVKINLRRNPDLIQQWLATDVGHRYVITNLPTLDLPPQPVDQLLEGYTEAIDPLMWEAWLNGSPSSGYEVYQVEDGSDNRSRIIPGTSTLDLTYLSTDTSLSVTSSSVAWIDSATYPADFPFAIVIAGEVMTCTAITGTGLTQTFTVTRALYGTAKTLPAGSVVQLYRPAAIAL